MKTTLNLDDRLWARLKSAAARQGKTMSDLVDLAIRNFLRDKPASKTKLAPLPTWKSGGMLVDVADRDALYRVLDGR
jgi:hypothetical protein